MYCKNILIALCVTCLTGCATSPPIVPAAELQGADYGAYPKDYKKVVEDYYSPSLKDPYSAHYAFPDKPIKGYTRTAPVAGGKPRNFGYVITACVNAKNGFGAYTGDHCDRLLIRNGVVLEQIPPNVWFAEPWYR
jgi:hypothetical protein